MCEVKTISRAISSLGRRTFSRRLQMATPVSRKGDVDLDSLLNGVDALCEQLHKDFPTITAEDYNFFSARLQILVDTLKMLRQELEKHPSFDKVERLGCQIDDLVELNEDMRNFKSNTPQCQALSQSLAAIGNIDFSELLA